MIAFTREKVQQIKNAFVGVFSEKQVGFWEEFFKGVMVGLLLLVFGGYLFFRLAYYNKAFPGTFISSIDVSGMTKEEALYALNYEMDTYFKNNPKLNLNYDDSEWSIEIDQLELSVSSHGLISLLSSVGREGTAIEKLSDQINLLVYKKDLPLPLEFDEQLLSDFVATAASEISNPPIPPRVYMGKYYNPKTNSVIVAENGVSGEEIDAEKVMDEIFRRLQKWGDLNISLTTSEVVEEITEDQLEGAVERAKKILGKSLVIEYSDLNTKEYREWKLTDSDLISFLSVVGGFNDDKIEAYVLSVAESVNRPSQNALFQFNDSLDKVESFMPAKNGLMVQTDKLGMSIQDGIDSLLSDSLADPVLVEVYETAPEITTSKVNDLGIETLIGKGDSTYYHSSSSRRYNVEFAASKMNGVLVPPGEEFSFNKALGEVSLRTGFKQAMIIKEGRTLLDDGGGVCQDSTTLFRAILDAGLPVTSWRNHSFRVGYYEQNSRPGFDATVFSPLPDLRFINDTSSHILIQTRANNMKLEYFLYGSDDGRVATITNYSQWDASPPPPDLYQDDPTLPIGVVKKVESAVPGLKTKFDYTVTRDEEVIYEKTFYSVYQPWQAVYMRGTKTN